MAEALALIYVLLAAPLVIAALWFFAEVAASRSTASVDDPRRAPEPIAVVIPAHNEESVLAATLVNLQPQLRPADRLVVVADNCTDQTAEVARQHGAEVLVRTNSALRGKGYALQHGLDHLRKDPPETVIFTDADCQHTDGLIPSLARITEITNAPVQPLYAMHAPEGSGPARAVAEFAWLLMNEVRIQGLFRLTGGTRITGAGQAFPWAIAETLNLASGEIVEDTALTLDLAKRGIRTRYVAEHRVSSTFPVDDEAAVVQRARWEHGSLSIQRRVA
ncbi:MAG: glycosyltransferase family 2 protein, partial [Pseudomonadota bacterium]